MGSWLAVTVGLFVLALATTVFVAGRVYRRAVRNVERERRRLARWDELAAEWSATASEALAGRPPGDPEADADVTRVNRQYIARFESEGLVPPSAHNFDPVGARAALRVVELVLDRNRLNLMLLLAGPVLGAAASIVALFPGWRPPS